jgi:hypothetical protein
VHLLRPRIGEVTVSFPMAAATQRLCPEPSFTTHFSVDFFEVAAEKWVVEKREIVPSCGLGPDRPLRTFGDGFCTALRIGASITVGVSKS